MVVNNGPQTSNAPQADCAEGVVGPTGAPRTLSKGSMELALDIMSAEGMLVNESASHRHRARPWITYWIDSETGMILKLRVSFDPPTEQGVG